MVSRVSTITITSAAIVGWIFQVYQSFPPEGEKQRRGSWEAAPANQTITIDSGLDTGFSSLSLVEKFTNVKREDCTYDVVVLYGYYRSRTTCFGDVLTRFNAALPPT